MKQELAVRSCLRLCLHPASGRYLLTDARRELADHIRTPRPDP